LLKEKGGVLKSKHTQPQLVVFLIGTLVSFFSVASSEIENTLTQEKHTQTSVSLTEILASSVARGNTNVEDIPSYQSSTWLAASPAVGLSYLSSQEDFGSDEAEVSVNLSIKSALQREIDQKLVKINKDIRLQQSDLRKLYLSGLIRESLWSHKIAKANESYIQKKLSILKRLQENNEQLVLAGETSDYGLLLIKKETINTEIKALENQQVLQKWKIQYQAITGQTITSMKKMPDIIEDKFELSQTNISQHPKALFLTSNWQQQRLMTKANTSDADPWTVSAIAKTIDTAGFKDNQLGLSFEIPLSFVEVNSQSLKNQSDQSKAQFELEYRKNYLEINQQLNKHSVDRQFLIRKQNLLKRSLDLSKKIMKQIEHLKAQNEMGQELVLRRVIDAIEIQNENAVISLLIQQNNSLLRQAVGISL